MCGRSTKRRLLATVLTMIAVAPLSGCSPAAPDEAPPASASARPNSEVPEISATTRNLRGSVVESQIVEDPSTPLAEVNGTQIKMIYRSVSGIDGSQRDVSGTVVVPSGPPPPGGWPIVAYGHGVNGVGNECGPSAYRDLMGYDLVVASLVKLGYVVALTDYEGLGHPGVHPFLEPKTAAFNMIDSVRAARQLVEDTSTRWVAVGISQGGQASWAANEYAGEYGEGLEFLGSASLAPAIDLSKLPTLAESGWLTTEQQVLLPVLVHGLRATHPELNPDDYLHGSLARNTEVWLACTGPLLERLPAALAELRGSDEELVSRAASERLSQVLEGYAMPQRPATRPMLVITGEDDETVRWQWVRSAVQKACGLGDSVEFVVRPDEGHANLNGGARVGNWIAERMADKTPVDTCGEL